MPDEIPSERPKFEVPLLNVAAAMRRVQHVFAECSREEAGDVWATGLAYLIVQTLATCREELPKMTVLAPALEGLVKQFMLYPLDDRTPLVFATLCMKWAHKQYVDAKLITPESAHPPSTPEKP